ncbi:MAG: hypothetical protein ACRCUY_09530 [Thermoguttaceae bacterium]
MAIILEKLVILLQVLHLWDDQNENANHHECFPERLPKNVQNFPATYQCLTIDESDGIW